MRRRLVPEALFIERYLLPPVPPSWRTCCLHRHLGWYPFQSRGSAADSDQDLCLDGPHAGCPNPPGIILCVVHMTARWPRASHSSGFLAGADARWPSLDDVFVCIRFRGLRGILCCGCAGVAWRMVRTVRREPARSDQRSAASHVGRRRLGHPIAVPALDGWASKYA